jgi:hypothetical protein
MATKVTSEQIKKPGRKATSKRGARKPKLTTIEEAPAVTSTQPEQQVQRDASPSQPAQQVQRDASPLQVQLTEMEYQLLLSMGRGLPDAKSKLEPGAEARMTLNMLEADVWSRAAKKFGWASIEDANNAGFTYRLKTVFVLEQAPLPPQVAS